MTTQGNKGDRARKVGRNKIRQLGLEQQRKNREAEIAKIIEQLERYEVSGIRRVPFGIKKSKDQLLKEFKNLMGIDYKNYRGITQRYSTEDKGTSRFDLRGRGRGSELDVGRNIPLTSSKQKNKKPTQFLNQNKQINKEEKLKDSIPRKKPLSPPIPKQNPRRTPSLEETLRKNPKFKKVMDNQIIQRFNYPEAGDDSFEDGPQAPSIKKLKEAPLSAPEDRNIIEQLVSKLLGRDIKFEDIPDDDPEFGQGEGGIEYPAGRPDLRMGGMTARSGATTKFKKPLGMKGGGAISSAERKRIARIVQDYKQKKARKSNGKRTNR